MEKQTAVDWLVNQLNKQGFFQVVTDEEIQQAKEMEKQQRQKDTNHGYSQGWDDGNEGKEPMKPIIKTK